MPRHPAFGSHSLLSLRYSVGLNTSRCAHEVTIAIWSKQIAFLQAARVQCVEKGMASNLLRIAC